ncbi:cupredoxin domain-containing protein [Oceanobacillus damuensis]|uniref:cupredoxin domain-containing protein n=1 Tax=Oceanobacillus damuensis TaxID=937928 RepID=UPI00082DCEA8|nr:cupredoxin domain-containing protein [Oceanobacillus damuensis]
MPISLYITLISVFILTILIIWKTIYHREKITVMTGMMISMVLGMVVGLIMGVILGVLLSGDLFSSTLLAMIIGIAAGFLAGLLIGLMAVLDGALAGMMGGMMGAMLGEMIAPEHQDALIKVMFLLFIGTIIILLQLMQQEFIKSKALLSQPIVMTVLFIFIIIGYNQLGTVIPSSDSPNIGSNHHSKGVNNLVILADEHSFSPSHTKITAGKMVTITLDNIGEVEHDLEITGLEAENMEDTSHNHQEIKSQIHVHSMSGEKQDISFIALIPGKYSFTCTIPGHAESGMFGIIEVLPS